MLHRTLESANSPGTASHATKNVPDILSISRRPQGLQRRRTAATIEDGTATGDLGRSTTSGRGALAPQLVEVLEITLRNRGDVLSAEDTDLELLVLARGQLRAAVLEVVEILVDDRFSTNVLGNVETVALVGDELTWGGKIDAAGDVLAIIRFAKPRGGAGGGETETYYMCG